MAHNKYKWVAMYRCKLCGAQPELEGDDLSEYGATQFPDTHVPAEVQHKCKRTEIGLAELVGIKRIAK